MKKLVLTLEIIISLILVAALSYFLYKSEYFSQLRYVDNIIGASPVVLSISAAILGLLLLWIAHRNVTALTCISILFAVNIALLFPSYSGNWFPLSNVADTSKFEAPSAKVMPVETLNEASDLILTEDFPRLDGATALYPLYNSFASAVFQGDFADKVVCTNTASAYQNIVDGKTDIIFVAAPSEKQKGYAKKMGGDLVFTPIGREAFVFLVGVDNPIDNLTYSQIKNIYSGKTSKWKTLGWENGGDIIAFQRPEGSGSQSGLQKIMGNVPIFKARPLPDNTLLGRGRLTEQISVEYNGVQPAIGYSYRYYATKMYPNENSKLLCVNGVFPSERNISEGKYPFSSQFYAVTKGQPSGNIKKFIAWILSEQGQRLVEKTGYVRLA